ncbi:MAG: hypothetical protein JWO82_1933 [Akkermansiaceae bacterium]|nr:hypothetical protein [Akkermansiaceae bacterium]
MRYRGKYFVRNGYRRTLRGVQQLLIGVVIKGSTGAEVSTPHRRELGFRSRQENAKGREPLMELARSAPELLATTCE